MISNESKSSFFIIVAVFESSSDAAGFSLTYEERFTLIKASSDEEARSKADQYARDFVHSYQNVQGDEVTWRCKQVVDVALVVDEEFVDGAEIYGR